MSIWCCSDLHGQKNLYDKILETIKPEDTLVILGDLCDRGKYGYEMMKDALSRDNILYLKGNHEDLFVKAAREYKDPDNMENENQSLHKANGGRTTFNCWRSDGSNMNFINQIAKLDKSVCYTNTSGKNIILTHSGSLTDPLWDRTHYVRDEKIEKNTIIVHGHTPIPCLMEERGFNKNIKMTEEYIPLYYNNNQKICIDCGSAWTNITVLLNLDTFEKVVIQ
jgi:predicted phosphodiesterase